MIYKWTDRQEGIQTSRNIDKETYRQGGIYTRRHIDKETYRQGDIQTRRHIDKQTYRQVDIQTSSKIDKQQNRQLDNQKDRQTHQLLSVYDIINIWFSFVNRKTNTTALKPILNTYTVNYLE